MGKIIVCNAQTLLYGLADDGSVAGKCPLCGEDVGWAEEKAGLYACLTVCVPAVRHPNHLLQKHPQYLHEAKKLARPVFYSSAALTAAAALLLTAGLWQASLAAAALSAVFFMIGWRRRKALLHRHRLLYSV
ncbi:MAG: hypothetical protein QW318_04465 [Candidatus Caldarchaeum sp.]|uniref:Uncharacterized protein n=1 Tax=Caldiarchaeum subterraneum TaxID=311458 RepID=A0A7J3G409_CALS0